ncbi:biotin/lipoyl-containing protein [Dechloromonas sp. ZY10]|uniref:biotin/lipoyl-containing protein n=1 Tax=Dechloromonas aquae TaxID=2664436 RepID=UPI0035274A6F
MPTHIIPMPRTPECWESCGACAQGEVFILDIAVAVGDWLDFDQTILTLETGKVALDIPSPRAGRITALHITPGDRVAEGAPLLTLESD